MAENTDDMKRPRAARRAALAELWRLLKVAPLPRWATPLLIALGVASSLAETVGITLVLLFFYLAMGQVELATSTSGVLGDALRHATGWFHSSTETALVVLLLIIVRGALAFANTLISAHVGEQINEIARNRVHLQYLSTSYSFFQRHDEAYLMEVLGTETWLISGAYSSLTRIIVSSCSIFLFLSFLLALSVKITVMAVAASMVVSAGMRHLSRPMQQLGSGVKLVHQRLGEHMLMTLQGMRTIRAYGQEKVHQERFEGASAEARRVALGLARLSALVSPLTEVGYLVVLCLVIASANMWGIGFATSLTAVALLYRLQPHMRELETSLLYMAQIEPQLRSIRLMLAKDDKEYPKPGHLAISRLVDKISFRNVTFRYDARSDSALRDVSFDIPVGKITALVGASGAGKTTIVNLLLGLYSATEGCIRIDDRPIGDLRRTEWLGLLAIAGQDVDLVEGTVIDNVRMSKNDASEEEILDALRVAGISEMVEALPDKYNSWIGQHGTRFSGGQRQRLGLARAIVRKPEFLILDEAMSALDRSLEESVKRAIQQQLNGRTLLLITHRLESVLDADHVVCLEAGRVCAEGPPAKLLADSSNVFSRNLRVGTGRAGH
ncbi:ABC transporter ATP-binding protein [Bradyrhizobium sp. CCBAU 51753]|uniref:ABC transporter ATP-binding protein n=1 Tax=Bradyrhizobium sp. CCBAU 51753 TaxID=1325100 RepID=UPI00188CB7AF|nr:ABC transporter ATP-binding protein [Bradyrhizobium sp. CCBAU 51753]QOZ24914.1 ABC transporter ATP-binding protein [Bradyrhizobium sp. CCBAU 51753]